MGPRLAMSAVVFMLAIGYGLLSRSCTGQEDHGMAAMRSFQMNHFERRAHIENELTKKTMKRKMREKERMQEISKSWNNVHHMAQVNERMEVDKIDKQKESETQITKKEENVDETNNKRDESKENEVNADITVENKEEMEQEGKKYSENIESSRNESKNESDDKKAEMTRQNGDDYSNSDKNAKEESMKEEESERESQPFPDGTNEDKKTDENSGQNSYGKNEVSINEENVENGLENDMEISGKEEGSKGIKVGKEMNKDGNDASEKENQEEERNEKETEEIGGGKGDARTRPEGGFSQDLDPESPEASYARMEEEEDPGVDMGYEGTSVVVTVSLVVISVAVIATVLGVYYRKITYIRGRRGGPTGLNDYDDDLTIFSRNSFSVMPDGTYGVWNDYY